MGNDLILSDPSVSRHHCVLESTTRGLRLRDLHSTNGTRLGAHYVESAYLVRDSTLSLGNTALRIEILDEVVSERLPSAVAFGPVLGRSAAMRRIFAMLPRVASSDSTVLIQGETGTGKTLLAEAIHDASERAGQPFVVVDCASIATSLIESELFGHERGSFTGAHATRLGALEEAAGGTVFLEEIGELPLEMQPKLLRVLENRRFRRVGGNGERAFDARIIAATNRNLRAEVNQGTFRADLLYRLDVVQLTIPPLRERPEDLCLMIEHFYRQVAADGDPGAPPALVHALSGREWPGNIRELRAAVERMVLLGDVGTRLEQPAETDASIPFRVAKQRATEAWERQYLTALMDSAGGRITRAARMARMDRNHLRERLVRLGITDRRQ